MMLTHLSWALGQNGRADAALIQEHDLRIPMRGTTSLLRGVPISG